MTPPSIADVLSRDEDGWIAWEGGPCPVPPDTRVSLKFRDGDVYPDTRAGSWANEITAWCNWHHTQHDSDCDIIAYRVVSK